MARGAVREIGVEGRGGEAHERPALLSYFDKRAVNRDEALGAQGSQSFELRREIDVLGTCARREVDGEIAHEPFDDVRAHPVLR